MTRNTLSLLALLQRGEKRQTNQTNTQTTTVKTNRDRDDVTPSGVRCQRRREGPGCVLTQALEITFVPAPKKDISTL